jgi:phage terminase small subunit
MVSSPHPANSEIEQRHPWLFRHGLNPRQQVFVLTYLETLNATTAADRAGYRHPRQQGSRLLSNVVIKRALAEGRDHIANLVKAEPEKVVAAWWQIATADAADLVTHKLIACRFCWGRHHHYQWRTAREFTEALHAAVWHLYGSDTEDHAARRATALMGEDNHPTLPGDAGGYRLQRHESEPNPDCPECDGVGISRVVLADLDDVSPATRALFDGVKTTKDGIEVKLQSRADALRNLARHFGLLDTPTKATAPVAPDGLARLLAAINARARSLPVRDSREVPDDAPRPLVGHASVPDTDEP